MWPDEVHRELAAGRVGIVGYVPDAGLKRLIELCQADPAMRAVPLTTEEEGIGLTAGAWLGGARSALLMQSSGVGNVINALGMVRSCSFPLLMLVTMRGGQGEFNPWQVPVGQAVPAVLSAMGVGVEAVSEAKQVATAVRRGLENSFENHHATAILISQGVIGIKSFQEQAEQ